MGFLLSAVYTSFFVNCVYHNLWRPGQMLPFTICCHDLLFVANVGDGWFVATEKSDYIQAIGLSSAIFQHCSLLSFEPNRELRDGIAVKY